MAETPADASWLSHGVRLARLARLARLTSGVERGEAGEVELDLAGKRDGLAVRPMARVTRRGKIVVALPRIAWNLWDQAPQPVITTSLARLI